jgi:hypothetical protein
MSSSPSQAVRPRIEFGFNDTALAFFGAAVLLLSAVLWTAHGQNVEKTDFSLTYVGAKLVHDGMGPNLYDLSLQKQLRDSLYRHPVPLFFEHPPFEALLLSPLAAYPYRTAYLAWGLMNATAWLALIFFLRPYLPWPSEGLGYIFMWLLFAPLWVALYQGQSSLFLLAAFALAFVLLKSKKEFTAGVALGFGLLKLQFVLPFVVIFLIRRRWRFLAGFAACALVLAFVSIAAVGWKGAMDYVQFLLAIGNNPQNISFGSGVDMPTIHGFVFAILGRNISGTALNTIVAVLSIALLAWVAMQWKRRREMESFDLMFSAAVAASLLSGSHMFTHDFSPLILPMLVVAGHRSETGSMGRLFSGDTAVKAALFLFWMFPIYFLSVKWHCLYLLGPVLLLFTWSTMRQASSTAITAGVATMVTG